MTLVSPSPWGVTVFRAGDPRMDTAGGFLLHDTFTDTNGTLLTAHTMDVGAGWSFYRGTFDIQSNRGNCVSLTSGEATAVADAGAADVVASVTVRPSANNVAPGLIVRASGVTAFWVLDVVAVIGTGGSVRLLENNGGYAVRASAALDVDAGTDYALELTASGTSMSGKVDTVERVTYGSATFNQAATSMGMRSDRVAHQYEDFMVVSA